jgi:hypothetical protein
MNLQASAIARAPGASQARAGAAGVFRRAADDGGGEAFISRDPTQVERLLAIDEQVRSRDAAAVVGCGNFVPVCVRM